MTDQPASTSPLAAGLPLVQGRCPACGTKGLFLGDGGYITCSLVDCPQPDAATEVIADFWDARQHGTFTFCSQLVGHVTMTAFANKITEKVTAVGQRAEAVAYANEQKQRAERAEATVTRVSAECDRIEAAVHANPQDPDFDGAYLAAIKHIRTALDEPKED
jgi:hypothetical protein